MKIKKILLLFIGLLSIGSFFSISVSGASAFETRNGKKKIEGLFVPQNTSLVVPHGENATINFSLKEDYVDDEFLVSFEENKMVSNTKSGKFKGNFQYSFSIQELGESSTTLNAYSDAFFGEIQIYAYSTLENDYISTVSATSAKRLYFQDLYSQGLVSEEDYNEIVFGTDYTSEIITSNASFSTENIFVQGKVEFTDSNNVVHPAQNVKVQIFDADLLGNQFLETVYTDTSGEYYLEIENDDSILENGYDIVVKISFETEDYHVEDFWAVYSFSFEMIQDSPDGLIIEQNVTFSNGGERNDALQIHQAGKVGYEYLRFVSADEGFPFLRFIFPTFMSQISFYTPIVHNIDLTSYNGHDWDAILHEFGHYVADIYGFTDFWPAEHDFSENETDEEGKLIGPMLAWSEGWAHYYEIIAQKYFAVSLGVPDAGDLYIGPYNIETNSDYLLGEANEWVVARLLYDISDIGYNEARDQIQWGDNQLFYLLERAASELLIINDLSAFMQTLKISSSNESMGKLLSYYNISSQPSMPLNNSSGGFFPPTLTWIAGGGSQEHPNNKFTLFVKSSLGETLFSVFLGSDTSYTLSTSQWNTVLSQSSSYVSWNIKAEETTTPSTGPYYSTTFKLYKPSATILSVGVPTSGTLTTGDFDWYKFIAPSTGYYTVFTTGNTDTFGEFFNYMVSGYDTTGIIAYDNDSGDGLNFKKRLYLTQGTIVFLRVRGDDWVSIGTYSINITYSPSSC